MKKLLNSVLTVQRYKERPTRQNYFNESVIFFNGNQKGSVLKRFLYQSV